jgi:hypothetical protein
VTALIVIVTACVKLARIRREIFSRPSWESPVADPRGDQLKQARARREARSLMAEDPTLARSLGIGRPDLGRGYDDGGLIDLNTAPAPVIAQVCGLDAALAEAIVAARLRQGGVFYNVDELLIAVRMPPSMEGELRERAVF